MIIFVLCLWFLVVIFFSLPVATWESIRPLTQAELGNIIFDPLTAKDQDLFLQVQLYSPFIRIEGPINFLMLSPPPT